jgi:hypothetical protein
MTQRLFFILISLLVVAGCGPEETARDAANKVSDEYVKAKSNEYRRYEGTYHGTIRGADKVTNVEFTVILFNVFVIDGQSNQVKEVPNLHGALASCPGGFGNGNQCLGDSTTVGSFGVGQVDSVEGKLKFTGYGGSRADSDLILTVQGQSLDGMIYNNATQHFKSKIHLDKVD